jgi:NADH-quinone oxidoreductase subunit G
MEEGSEFLERLKNAENETFPMFTSCCPGWIRFVKTQYPDMVDQLSTAKSPQQMFGAIAKSYYAKILNVDPSKIFSVSIMPCTAKKYEAGVPVLSDAGAGQDVDVVLTTREVERLIRAEHITVKYLDEEPLDTPLGIGSGAAVIFGATGGVMEAALRSAYFLVTGENPAPDAFKDVRGRKGWKEASFDIAGTTLKVAVASGLGNTRRLIEAIRRGEVQYHFVEIMACPGGCAGGGGQPIWDGQELAEERAEVLYGLDQVSNLRFSHENPSITKVYEEFFGSPLSHKSHELLHTDHHAWELDPTKK